MNGQQLKNSILKLAIQGKLVPQDSSDEPASVLLSRIREEKQRLVDEKIIKKSKPLSPITDDEKPFDIPESWEWVRLGDICYLSDGEKAVGRRIVLDAKFLRKKHEGINSNRGKLIKKGDYIILVDGENSGEVFKCPCNGYMGSTFKELIINETIYKEYLFVIMMYYKDLFRNSKKGSAIPHLNKDLFSNLTITLPPLAEQHRIVAKIEELLPLVEEYDEAQKKLDKLNDELPEKLKKSVLQQAIMGRLGTQNDKDEPASELLKRIKDEKAKLIKEKKIKKEKALAPITDDEKPFDIPESWEWVRLGEICTFLSRGRSPKYTEKSDIPVFAQKCNLKEGGISLDKAKFLDPNTLKSWNDIYKILEGDVLLNSTGTGTVGRTRLFKNEYLGKYSFTIPDSHVTIVRTSDSIMSDYVFYVLSSFTIQKYFEDNLAGSTNQKELYINIVHDLCFPLPPLAEQHRIVAKIEELLTMIERLKLK